MTAQAQETQREGTGILSAPVEQEQPRVYAEKFNTVDDLEKAYVELQRKLGTPAPSDEPPQEPTEAATESVLESAGFDFNALQQEYAEQGELTRETRDRLNASGFPDEAIDAYIAGQRAIADQYVNGLYAHVGGKEQWDALMSWAAENASDATLTGFNQTISSMDMDQAKAAVSALMLQRQGSEGPGTQILGGTQAPATTGFRSKAEQNAAITDPKFKIDAAYRADVIKRIAATADDIR